MRSLLLALTAGLVLAAPAAHAQSGAPLDALWAEYVELSSAFEATLAEVDETSAMTTQGDRLRREGAELALQLADVTAELIERDDSLGPDDIAAAQDQRLTAIQIRGALLVEVAACEEAVDVLEALLEEPAVETRPLLETRTRERLAEARACVAASTTVAVEPAGPGPAATPAVVVQDEPESESSRQRTGWILAGSGGALVVGALVWDASQNGLRREFRDLDRACRRGDGCDEDRLRQIDDSLSSSRVPHALLYGVGGVAAITGLTLALLPERSQDGVALTPQLAPGYAGVRFATSF